MKNNIQGAGVALITPFLNDGTVDYEALSNLTEYVISNGIDYIVALGTTAETPTLTCDEKRSVVACIRERNGDRVPMVLGAGGYATEEVVKKIKDTDLTGIAAILSVTPYYNKPSQEGLYRHYSRIAEESPVPVILYNVPSRTGVNLHADTTLRLAHDFENILGIKEACGLIPQLSQILKGRPERFKVISGDDCMALPLIAMGGDGVISVAANAFPESFCRMIDLASKGDIKGSSELYLRLFDTMEALFLEGNPAGIKGVLSIKGMIQNNLRLPLIPASDGLMAKYRELLQNNRL